MFNNAPANKQFGNNQEREYRLLDQEGLFLTINSPDSSLDKPGKLFLCNGLVKAVVISNDTELQLKLESYVQVTEVNPLIWLPNMNKSSYYRNFSKSIGSLNVQCNGLKLSKAGFTGWSVFNAQGDLLLAGNDKAQLGICSYNSDSTWLTGNYKLEIREFSYENRQTVSYGYKWYQVIDNNTTIQDLNPGIRMT